MTQRKVGHIVIVDGLSIDVIHNASRALSKGNDGYKTTVQYQMDGMSLTTTDLVIKSINNQLGTFIVEAIFCYQGLERCISVFVPKLEGPSRANMKL